MAGKHQATQARGKAQREGKDPPQWAGNCGAGKNGKGMGRQGEPQKGEVRHKVRYRSTQGVWQQWEGRLPVVAGSKGEKAKVCVGEGMHPKPGRGKGR